MNCATRNSFVYALFTLLAASLVAAQTTAPSDQSSSGQTSLGDYARKMHKDPSAKVQPKVFDNDNLPTNDKLSIVGEATTASNANGSDSSSTEGGAKPPNPADAKDSNAAKPAASPEDQQVKKQAEWKSWQDKLASQKNAIDLASRELDVAQKEYQLRAAAMYGDVGNRLRNSAQWDKQDADYKQQIADKQKAVEDAKQKLEDMEEAARKAGVPAAMREP
jgi:hypothetical protein